MKDKIIYFNVRGPYGVETIDEYSEQEFKKDNPTGNFRKYVLEMLRCTIESGNNAYMSQRCDKTWRNR